MALNVHLLVVTVKAPAALLQWIQTLWRLKLMNEAWLLSSSRFVYPVRAVLLSVIWLTLPYLHNDNFY